jgi:hypothetical protein
MATRRCERRFGDTGSRRAASIDSGWSPMPRRAVASVERRAASIDSGWSPMPGRWFGETE